MLKVLWLTNIPSPYRVAFFNELGKLCDLTVVFERKSSSERDDSWKNFQTEYFTPVFLKGIKCGVAEAVCPGVVKYLKKKKFDKIVVTNYSTITGILAVAALKFRKIPYTVEGDGAFAGSGEGMKEKLKKWLLSDAEQCFSTGTEHDKYYRTYGVPEERIVRYPFTSLFERDILQQPTTSEEKQALREKLAIKEERVVVSVGQFIHRKGYDILFEALAKMDAHVGCYVIGGQPTEEYLKQIEALNLKNVHFAGFKQKAELNEYYMAADAFVLPTREDIWGLVVNEAMAKGLPVVTTDRCVAGLELIKEASVGEIVPVEDPDALARALSRVLTMENTSGRILEAIAPYTIENMARCHIQVWEG